MESNEMEFNQEVGLAFGALTDEQQAQLFEGFQLGGRSRRRDNIGDCGKPGACEDVIDVILLIEERKQVKRKNKEKERTC